MGDECNPVEMEKMLPFRSAQLQQFVEEIVCNYKKFC